MHLLTRRQVIIGLTIIQSVAQTIALLPYDELNQQIDFTKMMGAGANTGAWERHKELLCSSKLYKVFCFEGETCNPPREYELVQATCPGDIGQILPTIGSIDGRTRVLPYLEMYLSGHFKYRTQILALTSCHGLEAMRISNIVRLCSIHTPSSVLLSPPFSPFFPLPYYHISVYV